MPSHPLPPFPVASRGPLHCEDRAGARNQLLRSEAALVALAVVLTLLAMFGPALPASPHQHNFADQRTLWGMACALDVLSNLPFAAAGLWGLWALRRAPAGYIDAASQACARLFFAGLVCTAAGSAWYHSQPQDGGLVWDRLGMVLPFAGLLGLAITGRVSERAGRMAVAAVLLAGPLAVLCWARTGNLLPWAAVQFGGMLVLLGLALLPRRSGALPVHLGAVLAWYAAAKLLEGADHAVYAASGQWLSGHSLKHLLAAGAAWPVLAALLPVRGSNSRHGAAPVSGQNGAHTAAAGGRAGV